MRFLSRVLQGGLEVSIRALEALGVGGTRWEWKKRAWQQGLGRRIAEWENLERGVRVRMKMCRSCRALVERGESICPSCGASLRGAATGGAHRLVALLLPGFGSVTLLLVTINIVMSLVIFLIWGSGEGHPGLMGLLSPPGKALYLFGEKWTPAILAGEVWRLVTANYLHGGIVHLFVNCYTLTSLGPLIEESFGGRKFFLIYTFTGIAAIATSAIVRPGTPSVGASGALFGLLGFAIVFGRYRAGRAGRAISDHLLRYLVYSAVLFLIPGIDNAAHAGGAVAGGLLGLFVGSDEPQSRGRSLALNLLTTLALLITVGSFVAMALAYHANLQALQGAG